MNRIILFAIASIALQLQSAAPNEQTSLQPQERSWCDVASLYKKEIILAGAVALGSVLLFKKYTRTNDMPSLKKYKNTPFGEAINNFNNAINDKSSAEGMEYFIKGRNRNTGKALIKMLDALPEDESDALQNVITLLSVQGIDDRYLQALLTAAKEGDIELSSRALSVLRKISPTLKF